LFFCACAFKRAENSVRSSRREANLAPDKGFRTYSPMLDLVQVNREIERSGLAPRGALLLAGDERHGALQDVTTIVMVGAIGAQGWSAFAESPESDDDHPHPLDRWSRRIIDGLARALDAKALYPFEGPPYWPFQRWAMRAEPVHVSPVGVLIHPEHGLWHSYRGALGFREPLSIPATPPSPSPCGSCAARPCLAACPVGAFTIRGYDVAACAAHLSRPEGRPCMDGGCLARRACPIGIDRAHGQAQAQFHMRAFLKARSPAAT
jgi:ferredoxin